MEQAAVWETGHPVEQQEKGRRCTQCGKMLSRYNKNDICHSHFLAQRQKHDSILSNRIALEDPLQRKPYKKIKETKKKSLAEEREIFSIIALAVRTVALYYNVSPQAVRGKQYSKYKTERRNIALLIAAEKVPRGARPYIARFFDLSEKSIEVILTRSRSAMKKNPALQEDIDTMLRKI